MRRLNKLGRRKRFLWWMYCGNDGVEILFVGSATKRLEGQRVCRPQNYYSIIIQTALILL